MERRTIERIVQKLERDAAPPHLADLSVCSVLEMAGREKRARYYSAPGYRARCLLDGVDPGPSKVHASPPGTFATILSTRCYKDIPAYDDFISHLSTSTQKRRALKSKRAAQDPTVPVKRGRPKKQPGDPKSPYKHKLSLSQDVKKPSQSSQRSAAKPTATPNASSAGVVKSAMNNGNGSASGADFAGNGATGAGAVDSALDVESTSPKIRRGRPPKRPREDGNPPHAPRPRGRPRKVPLESEESKPKRPKGRPRKTPRPEDQPVKSTEHAAGSQAAPSPPFDPSHMEARTSSDWTLGQHGSQPTVHGPPEHSATDDIANNGIAIKPGARESSRIASRRLLSAQSLKRKREAAASEPPTPDDTLPALKRRRGRQPKQTPLLEPVVTEALPVRDAMPALKRRGGRPPKQKVLLETIVCGTARNHDASTASIVQSATPVGDPVTSIDSALNASSGQAHHVREGAIASAPNANQRAQEADLSDLAVPIQATSSTTTATESALVTKSVSKLADLNAAIEFAGDGLTGRRAKANKAKARRCKASTIQSWCEVELILSLDSNSAPPARQAYSLLLRENALEAVLSEAGGILLDGSHLSRLLNEYRYRTQEGTYSPQHDMDKRTVVAAIISLENKGKIKRKIATYQSSTGSIIRRDIIYRADIDAEGSQMERFLADLQSHQPTYHTPPSSRSSKLRKVDDVGTLARFNTPKPSSVRSQPASSASDAEMREYFASEWRIVAQYYGYIYGRLPRAQAVHKFLLDCLLHRMDVSNHSRVLNAATLYKEIPLGVYMQVIPRTRLDESITEFLSDPTHLDISMINLPRSLHSIFRPGNSSSRQKMSIVLDILSALGLVMPLKIVEGPTTISASVDNGEGQPSLCYFAPSRAGMQPKYWLISSSAAVYHFATPSTTKPLLSTWRFTSTKDSIDAYWDALKAACLPRLSRGREFIPCSDADFPLQFCRLSSIWSHDPGVLKVAPPLFTSLSAEGVAF